MIPSSPNITFEEQKTVVDAIFNFVLFNENIVAIPINNDNKDILENFASTIKNKHFRYFENRNIDCILNHKKTILYRHIETNKIIGYTHIDYFEKYWFGIYIDENYRGKKLGDLLLKYTLNKNELKDIDNVFLTVDSDNFNAIALYKKNGFLVESETNNKLYMKKHLHH
jgi:GNAT superfamily N-acetyltransferase